MIRQQHVCDYMTTSPHVVSLDESLSTAAKRMRELKTRHLPVVAGDTLKGVLSQRDVALAQAVGLDPRELSVEEAMTPEPFTVSPRTPLSRVARVMAARKYGCAVVTEGKQVRGIFTTVDALRALSDVLEKVGEEEAMAPSQVREVVLAEHENLGVLLDRTEERARDMLVSEELSDAEVHALRDASRELYASLVDHNELENRVLVPAIREITAEGAVRPLPFIQEHAAQQREFEDALMRLDDLSQPPAALAEQMLALVARIREDLKDEEDNLLCPELLREDPVLENAETD